MACFGPSINYFLNMMTNASKGFCLNCQKLQPVNRFSKSPKINEICKCSGCNSLQYFNGNDNTLINPDEIITMNFLYTNDE